MLCVALMWASGCFTGRPPKASISGKVNLRPPIVPATDAMSLMDPPKIAVAMEAPELLAVHNAPPRPRVVHELSEPPKPEKQPEPQIVPELSSGELDAAKAETQQNLDTTRKNLAAASGRSLNASQQDLVSKVRAFAENAREAIRSGDWVRAKNLSKKAEVLSEELTSSL
jgi:hypothetical protein